MSAQNTARENDSRPPVDPSIMAQANDGKLNDTDLAEVVGGRGVKTATIYISGMSECGTRNRETGAIIYRPCPRCGKPMHTEWYVSKWYCDPCNFSEFRPRKATWSGTVKSLIAAAK